MRRRPFARRRALVFLQFDKDILFYLFVIILIRGSNMEENYFLYNAIDLCNFYMFKLALH